jgi:hypothetical protein
VVSVLVNDTDISVVGEFIDSGLELMLPQV